MKATWISFLLPVLLSEWTAVISTQAQSFTEVGVSAGIASEGDGNGVAWGDYDNDGDEDIYATNGTGPNWLYRNNGNGTFTDVAPSARVDDPAFSVGLAWGDYDNDGDLDLYTTNIRGATNRLYRNNRDGTFTDVAPNARVDFTGDGTFTAWGDYDNDGNLDLYVNDRGGSNKLYRNNGNGTFTDAAPSAGVTPGPFTRNAL